MRTGRPPLPIGSHGVITVKQVDGRWEARVHVRDPDGKTRRLRRYRASAAAAKRALQEHLLERQPPTDGNLSGEAPLATAVEQWFEEAERRGRVRPATLRVYRSAWKRLAPDVQNLRLREVTTGRLSNAIEKLRAAAPGQVKNASVVLRSALSYAVRAGAITVNPTRELEPPKPRTRSDIRALTDDEVTELLRLAREHRGPDERGHLPPGPRPTNLLEHAIVVLAGTGLRTGELLALRWKDVDLDGEPPTLSVTGTVVEGTGKLHRQPFGKTAAAARTLALPPETVEVLKQRQEETGGRAAEPVFPNRYGGYVAPWNFRETWRAVVRGTDLEGVSPKTLRKTVATRLERALGAQAAARQLGHTTTRVTEQHYIARRAVLDHREAWD